MQLRYHPDKGNLEKTMQRLAKYTRRGFMVRQITAVDEGSDLADLYNVRDQLFMFAADTAASRSDEYLIRLGFLSHVRVEAGNALQLQRDHDFPILLSLHETWTCLAVGFVQYRSTVQVAVSRCASTVQQDILDNNADLSVNHGACKRICCVALSNNRRRDRLPVYANVSGRRSP